ncbi:uncharacterized protein A4U43_C06F3400 [Asparagus officinalis]|uniref:MIF4G domain-containing protein n=1 Tax=Asparagus officinalis TaxID=4686 RepID=A0A5P1EJ85_ASPOF|nr:regulator of nonsense transcripts UPF2 [Asparagus officinalis]XP_020269105.1 regulator of nonsense transcripts UPF2 [Asparagus officinalis]ONK66025.1 uncharacterized protein A4U43_C06F3400 [Asparagus officinalis]
MEHPEDERVSGEQHGKQDNEENVARLEEYKRSIEMKLSLRHDNLNPERPDSGFLRTLDSSIKKNTAVIKKLKQINDEQREGLMDELRSVNLSKFVSEAVAAICDAKLKTSDIQAAVQVCSLLHQRYKEFSPCLVQGLLKVFFPGKCAEEPEADKSLKAMKKRSTLKLLIELYFVGVIEDAGIFVNIVKDLTSLEHLKDRESTQTNLSILASFARQGRIFLGLHQPGQEVNDEFFRGLNVTADQKKIFKKAFHSYYDAVAELLQSEHSSLRLMELENAKILNARGELNDENLTSYEKLRKSYDHLFRGVSSLAEALDLQPPVMPDDGHTTRVTSGADVPSASGKESSVPEPIWDDDDTKAFYEFLPDLRAFVPAVLLGEAEPKLHDQPPKTQEESAPEPQDTEVHGIASSAADTELSTEGKAEEKAKDKEEKEKEKGKDSDKEKQKEKEKDTEKKGESEKEKGKPLDGTSLDALLQRLPGCVSRDLIDQLTVEFCYLNSKANRKKLVRALFNVPRTSLELLPYYSRLVATLSTCMKDIPTLLLSMLEEEFNFLINKKDQTNIETKIKNIRFIGELCKFKIAPAGLVFSCLKACLDDFNHHNIDVACNLLETCGRFLYRSPETTIRMGNMLEILMRLKNVKNLDPRHSTLVENAYYLCKPPERSARISKTRPPLHQYIRKLLFSDLDKSSVEHVLRQLRKLPWSECEPYLLKCFLKVHKGKYSHVHLIAFLTAGLSRYHDEFAVAVVDEVLEEIRVGLELNDYSMQQRRIAHMRFLGELYNYEHIIDSSVIFETLYLIIFYGHGTPEQDALDPPEDCFRIRMIITLLQTCGHYFDRGSSKRKLDRFLIYFQRYVLSKGALPLDVEFDIQDMFAELRPNMTRCLSIEEVNAALIELEEHEHTASRDKASSDKHSDSESQKLSSKKANGTSAENGLVVVEENGKGGHDEAINSESYSDTGSIIDPEMHEDEDELLSDDKSNSGSDGDDEDDSVPAAGSDEDENVQVHRKNAVEVVDPREEEDFDRELRALLQESLDSRKLELRARPTLNMMIPMNIFEGSTKDTRAMEGESGEETMDDEGSGSGGGSTKVRVKVLVKKGSKQQTKQMYIPKECSLIQSTKQKEAEELEEKQSIKRRILEYNEREEEESNGISSASGWLQTGGGANGGQWAVEIGREQGGGDIGSSVIIPLVDFITDIMGGGDK